LIILLSRIYSGSIFTEFDSYRNYFIEGTNSADPEHDEKPFFVGEVVYSSNVSTLI